MSFICSSKPFSLPTVSPRNYPPDFGKKLSSMYVDLVNNKLGMPCLPDVLPSAIQTFTQMSFEDVWQEANVVDVVHWLRGGRGLAIPNEWRPVLPHKL